MALISFKVNVIVRAEVKEGLHLRTVAVFAQVVMMVVIVPSFTLFSC